MPNLSHSIWDLAVLMDGVGLLLLWIVVVEGSGGGPHFLPSPPTTAGRRHVSALCSQALEAYLGRKPHLDA